MVGLKVPNWAPYLAFIVVVALVIVFSVATRGDSKETGSSSAPINRPLDPERLSDGNTPEATVLRFWQLIQQGNYPLATLLYHPRIPETFGVDGVMGALSLQRQTILQNRPVIENTRRSPLGTLVTVQTDNSERPQLFSFNLRKRNGQWRIVFDSVLGDALAEYVHNTAPKASAAAAGEKAVTRYRNLFFPKRFQKRASGDARSRSGGEPEARSPAPRNVPRPSPAQAPRATPRSSAPTDILQTTTAP